MNKSTKQLLEGYHTISRKLQAEWGDELPDDESKELHNRFQSAGRELISRCIMLGDGRAFLFLLEEVNTILGVIGQQGPADCIGVISKYLAQYYLEHGDLCFPPPTNGD